ncbi:MAG: hypothetical protein MUP17_10300 [candidate division Zixibacteria bacterium]|nr:hypothetical protein [candidate division Zixibacteria bacterium]
MKRFSLSPLVISFLLVVFSCSTPPSDVKSKLAEWTKGVWILQDGSYAIYTDTHYFVISASGDSSSANIYCGASQIQFHNKGIARKQILRIRQFPGSKLTFFKEVIIQPDTTEVPLMVDSTQFAPNACNIKDGIIYDSITEVKDDYILLTTCNGDHEKIYSNGVSVYLPAGGGEAYAFRIERF